MFQPKKWFSDPFSEQYMGSEPFPQDLEMPGHVFTPKQLNANLLWVD